MRLGWCPGYEAKRVECPVSPFLIWPWNMTIYVLLWNELLEPSFSSRCEE